MLSVEYSEAIVEVLDILKHSDETIYSKIPKKLIEFWERNKSNTYKPILDHTKLLKDMNLKEKTKDILAMLYLNYMCDEKEKSEIKAILANNEKKYQKELREKYNPDNVFKNKKEQTVVENINLPIEVKKEKFLKRLIRFIKGLFKKTN